MKKIILLGVSILLCGNVMSQKIDIQGKRVKAKDVCGSCKPGNQGPKMLMKKNTFQPQIEDDSTPLTVAYNILGHVFPEDNLTGKIKIPCSTTDTQTPFAINLIKKLGNTGNGGTKIDYSEKETLQINVALTVETDLDNIKQAQPNIDIANLEAFRAKLNAAYNKFSNKELTIAGRYYEYSLDENAVVQLARNFNYKDCFQYMNVPEFEKRIITAVGLVHFDITSSNNSIDQIAAALEADAKTYGITFGIKAEFKRNISKALKKTTESYYQVVVWRTLGLEELKHLR